jgi:hypothetical protein
MSPEEFAFQCVIYSLFFYLFWQVWFGCLLAAVQITYAVVRHIVLILPAFVRVVKEAFRVAFSGPPMWLDAVFILVSIMMAIRQVTYEEARRGFWWYYLLP